MMKLASLKAGGRDGTLVVVSRDLGQCVTVPEIAATLQAALDDWTGTRPGLEIVSADLNAGRLAGATAFDQTQAAAPLPRAYQWADGSAYVNHVELVRRARGAEMPESFWTEPLMYQGGSDGFLGARDDIVAGSADWGIDFEAEIAVITDDVPMAVAPDAAGGHIQLLMLVNDVSLRNLIPGELGKGFGFFQSKPASAFSPVAVTVDELGPAWDGGRLDLALLSELNGQAFGCPNARDDMTFDFPTLIAHAAKTRSLTAGSIVGSGTVSNKQDTAHGSAIADGGLGYSCIAEVRMIETINSGAPTSGFLRDGDSVKIEMLDPAGASIFGTIEQTVRVR